MLFGVLGIAACQPGGVPPVELVCSEELPEAGTIEVGPLDCDERRFGSEGEARGADFLLANSVIKAMVRHPQSSLSLVGIGGGGIVDFSPHGVRDRVHEIVPLIGGGGLVVDELELLEDGVRVAGVVASLPDRVAEAEGERAEYTWRIRPDQPFLYLDGADGLWVHPRTNDGLFGIYGEGQLLNADVIYSHDGTLVEDLGGAVRLEGVTRIGADRSRNAWQYVNPVGQPVSGRVPEGAYVAIYAEETRLGVLEVNSSRQFSSVLPPEVTGVRAEASGFAPGPFQVPADDLELTLGDAGGIDLRVVQDAVRPVVVTFTDGALRNGWAYLPPTGGLLAVGAGVYEVTVTGALWQSTRTVRVEVGADTIEPTTVRLDTWFEPERRGLVALDRPADRSRTHRVPDGRSIREAAARGASYLVMAPEDDVAGASVPSDAAPYISVGNGVKTTADGRYEVVSWPWGSNSRKAGHGAPDPRDLDAQTTLALVSGAGKDRYTVVDLNWMRTVSGPPWQADPAPWFVYLEHPASTDWSPWYAWLDAGRAVQPAGPWMWVPTLADQHIVPLDIDYSLQRFRTVAGNGPLIRVGLDGVGPGGVTSERTRRERWFGNIEVLAEPDTIDTVTLIGSGGKVLATFGELNRHIGVDVDVTDWIVVVAEGPEKWAVSSPIWTNPP